MISGETAALKLYELQVCRDEAIELSAPEAILKLCLSRCSAKTGFGMSGAGGGEGDEASDMYGTFTIRGEALGSDGSDSAMKGSDSLATAQSASSSNPIPVASGIVLREAPGTIVGPSIGLS